MAVTGSIFYIEGPIFKFFRFFSAPLGGGWGKKNDFFSLKVVLPQNDKGQIMKKHDSY